MGKEYRANISAASTIGSRTENQDNLMIDTLLSDKGKKPGDFMFDRAIEIKEDKSYYFVVCDGMGGESGGKKNSEIAVNAIFSQLEKLKNKNNPIEVFKAILEANRQVISYLERNKMKGGTTMSLLKINNNRTMEIFNIGDSPIILVRDGEMFLISEEQNVAGIKLKNKRITKEKYEKSNEKNRLLGFLGDKTWKSMTNLYYNGPFEYKSGDIVMLASDGLLGALDSKTILKSLDFDFDASELIRLTKEVKDKKDNDNITVLMLQLLEN